MLTTKDIELARRFNDLDLSTEELEQLEIRITNDQTFKKDLEDYLGTRVGIIGLIEKENTNLPPSIHSNSRKNKPIVLLGLSLILSLLILLGFYFYKMNDNKGLLLDETQHFVFRISADDSRSVSSKEGLINLNKFETQLVYATRLYKEGKLNDTKAEIQKLENKFRLSEDQEVLAWWNVLILLKKENYDQAKEKLELISKNSKYNSKSKANELLNKY